MGFYIKLLLQPIISIVSAIRLLFSKPLSGVDLDTDDCVNYNKAYYFSVRNKPVEAQKDFAQFGKHYLQSNWGMVTFPNNSPARKQSEKEVLYSSLGAVRNRDLQVDNDDFERAAYGIIDNDMALLDPVPKKPEEVMDFRPSFNINSDRALSILAMLTVLKRAGDQYVANKVYPEYFKKYLPFILIPNISNIEEVLVSYHILAKYASNNILKNYLKLVVILLTLVYANKMSTFSKFIAKETIHGIK